MTRVAERADVPRGGSGNVRTGRPGKQEYHVGPRLLALASVAVIAFGVAMLYTKAVNPSSYLLFFFFLPIAGVAVVLGSVAGISMALLAVAATLLPSIWVGLEPLLGSVGSEEERVILLSVWSLFLIATGYFVGWVSERGGSLSLTQGLGGKAVEAIELERRRTGQDIHDGIAQYAAAAFLETEVLAGLTADGDAGVQKQVEKVKLSLGLLVDEARAMIGTLRPPALGGASFDVTLANLVKNFQERTGIRTELELAGNFSSHTDSVRICIYRTLQEALSNAERHSGASVVHVWAQAGKSSVDLIVNDNGKGLAIEDQDPGGYPGHYGLSGMRERAGYLGGRLALRSAPEEGTSIVLHIPVYERRRSAWF